MGALIHSDKHLVLNNRYALLGCIAVSGVGKVYRGRDLEQVKHQGLESRVLIHVLPTTQRWALDALFQQITTTYQRIRAPWILEPLAYGQDNDLAYVVLASPDSWELHSLLSQPTHSQPCYRSMRQRLKPLVKQHYLDERINPALLLCAKEALYLLATAFAPPIQALDKRATYRPLMPRKHLGQALMTGSLLTLFAIFTAVAGNAIMELGQPHAPTDSLLLAALPRADVATTVRGANDDREVMASPVNVLPLTEVKLQSGALPAVKAALAAPLKNKPAETSKAETAAAPPKVINTPAPAPEEPLPEPAVQPSGVEVIIQQAYAAMNAGDLGADAGALHFARQLREQAAEHPQVARLGQEITAAYLRQVRVALQNNDMAAAVNLLSTTSQLIQEFNLSNLAPAQQVLEDKVAELNQ